MGVELFIWYALRIGFDEETAYNMRLGKLLDYIAIEKIMNEGCKRKLTKEEDEEEFMRLLSYR